MGYKTTKPQTPHSVYLLRWPHMVKAGYSERRRWRSLMTRNEGCEVVGVWHFPTIYAASNAEGMAHQLLARSGSAVPSDAIKGGGYKECVAVDRPDPMIEAATRLLDILGGTRCISPDTCGRDWSPCSRALSKH